MLSKVCIDTKILDVLTGSELKLFMIVESYDEGLGSYVSPKKISGDHNIPLRTVQRIRKQLVDKGMLVLAKRDGHTFWEWTFKNAKNGVQDENRANTDEDGSCKDIENGNAKNDAVSSSSFKYINTTTTYSAKNGVHTQRSLESLTNKGISSSAKNGVSKNKLFEDVNKLIHISESVFEKAVSEYRIDEVKKAAVYAYQKKPRRPETYFLMTLKNKWYFDVKSGDFEKAVEKIEREKEREMERAKTIEMKKVEEETQRRQAQLEREKIKFLEDKLMKGEISINFENMNEFSRSRVNDAIKRKDYKLAAVHLLPYIQVENVEMAV